MPNQTKMENLINDLDLGLSDESYNDESSD